MSYDDQTEVNVRNAEAAIRDRQATMNHLAELQRRGILPASITTRFDGPDPQTELRRARERLAELALD